MQQPPPPPYAMLNGATGSHNSTGHPPPYHRNVPRYHHKKSSSGLCCKCLCGFCCCIFFIIFIQIILAVAFYVAYGPKIPSYSIQNFTVKVFDVTPDFSLNTEFVVSVKAENPNTMLGFIYGTDSSVVVSYSDTSLCNGKLPSFHQGRENTTVLNVDLKGKSEFGSGLQEAFMESRSSHRIPLLVKVKVPVSVVMGDNLPLREVIVFVNCSLVVDNLMPNKKINILSKTMTYDLQF